ncbi:transcriptional regulator [Antrihabitans cavernicola]|uniref:Transcriptional regulator n=1 Tax=Antrihabitans cavernicola TaxID=2495913 RepID=A0A5A7SBD9_9NOCA|nr:transcriptional regulator [Spelaeibacter cavernicola]KAA0022844.1 transcriptional regulator [Spelaeibacter cavernicola]
MTSATERNADAADHGRRRHRASLIILVIVASLGCLALGWWQWTRFESAGGTGQNLGYALQWPLFAGFVVYAYRRFVQLEDEAEDPSSTPKKKVVVREVPVGLLPERPSAARDDQDPQMREYNRYLAELSARETDRSTK